MLANNILFTANLIIFLLVCLIFIVYLLFLKMTKQRANLIKKVALRADSVTDELNYLIKQNKQPSLLKRNSLLVHYLTRQTNGSKKLALLANLQKHHNLVDLDNEFEIDSVGLLDARSSIGRVLVALNIAGALSGAALYLCFTATVQDVLCCDGLLGLSMLLIVGLLAYRPLRSLLKSFKKLPTLTELKEFRALHNNFDPMQDRYPQFYFLIIQLIMLSSFETLGIKRTRQLFELFLSQETFFFNSRRQGVLDLKVKFEDDEDAQALLHSKNVNVAELKELIKTYNRESNHFMLASIDRLLGELLKDAQIRRTNSMRAGNLDEMDSATRLVYYENSAKAINELTSKTK